ncbi:hypothetical protein GQ649_14130 [Rhodococcus sp. DSM 6344]|nr:hypothetical protein [Rhodococcus erythropolis]
MSAAPRDDSKVWPKSPATRWLCRLLILIALVGWVAAPLLLLAHGVNLGYLSADARAANLVMSPSDLPLGISDLSLGMQYFWILGPISLGIVSLWLVWRVTRWLLQSSNEDRPTTNNSTKRLPQQWQE